MDQRLRKIAFRAGHRGMKELDILLGGFAERYLKSLSSVELDQFEALLNQPDPDLFAWIMGLSEVPSEHDSAVMGQLKAFNLGPSDYSRQI